MNRALSADSTKAKADWCVATATRWPLIGHPLVYACLLWLIGLGVAGCQPASSDPPIVAIVNGRMITQEEFDYRWKELAEAVHKQLGLSGNVTSTRQALKQRSPKCREKWDEIGREIERERQRRGR